MEKGSASYALGEKNCGRIKEANLWRGPSMGEESLSALCREYGISRPTGYKWLERYRKAARRMRRPAPHAVPAGRSKPVREVELRIVDVRAAHPTWGARKIRRFMVDKGEDAASGGQYGQRDTQKERPASVWKLRNDTRHGNVSSMTGSQCAVADGLQRPLWYGAMASAVTD